MTARSFDRVDRLFTPAAPVPAASRRRPAIALVASATVLVVALATVFVVFTRTLHSGAAAPISRTFGSTGTWPWVGQGAYQVGDGAVAVSERQQPAPIASLAKVMTAYLVVTQHPLHSQDNGFTMTVTAADVADLQRRRAQDESVVTLRKGDTLTERQALQALLIASANNVAAMLAAKVSGSVAAFVDDMNAAARRLGMAHTTYTDPSGYDATTTSTALDQLTLARTVAGNDVLAAIMATRSVTLPAAGTITNTNELLGTDGFQGMKTGSHDAAGGCLMFRAIRRVDGREVEIIGVVMGQPGEGVDGAFAVARELVERLMPAVRN